MPFEDLVKVIETLRERIGTHRQSLQANETRTRMALIDPLLRALGWDTENPALVLPEYELDTSRDTTRRADYALLGVESKPAAVIEAKRLGAPLANYLDQMLTYASRAGIRYAGVTDGNHWEIYAVFDPKPLDERRLLDVSILNDAAHKCALEMLLLWRPNLASGQPVEPSVPVLADPADRQPPPPAPEPSPEPIAPPPTAGDRAYWEGKGSPESVRLVDKFAQMIQRIEPDLEPKYNKYYVGLASRGVARNFIIFRPRRKNVIAQFKIPRSDELTELLEESGLEMLPYDTRWKFYRMRVTDSTLEEHSDVLTDLIRKARDSYGG